MNANVIVSLANIEFCEMMSSLEFVHQFRDEWQWVTVAYGQYFKVLPPQAVDSIEIYRLSIDLDIYYQKRKFLKDVFYGLSIDFCRFL